MTLGCNGRGRAGLQNPPIVTLPADAHPPVDCRLSELMDSPANSRRRVGSRTRPRVRARGLSVRRRCSASRTSTGYCHDCWITANYSPQAPLRKSPCLLVFLALGSHMKRSLYYARAGGVASARGGLGGVVPPSARFRSRPVLAPASCRPSPPPPRPNPLAYPSGRPNSARPRRLARRPPS